MTVQAHERGDIMITHIPLSTVFPDVHLHVDRPEGMLTELFRMVTPELNRRTDHGNRCNCADYRPAVASDIMGALP
ncbi:hypothetical protein ACLB1Q_17620 [Escherichia coli]